MIGILGTNFSFSPLVCARMQRLGNKSVVKINMDVDSLVWFNCGTSFAHWVKGKVVRLEPIKQTNIKNELLTKIFINTQNTDMIELKIVETVPGWSHDITNISAEEIIVMLWANEIFDRDNPDTIACEV